MRLVVEHPYHVSGGYVSGPLGMSSKRGRPPLPPSQRRCVKVTVWVRPDVADSMFAAMGRRREELSRWTSRQFELFLIRERELVASQISELENRP